MRILRSAKVGISWPSAAKIYVLFGHDVDPIKQHSPSSQTNTEH